MTQKLGIVNLVSMLDEYPYTKLSFEYFRQALKLGSCTPTRLVALYLLVDQDRYASWKNLIDFACYTMGKIVRLRTRIVSGTYFHSFSVGCGDGAGD